VFVFVDFTAHVFGAILLVLIVFLLCPSRKNIFTLVLLGTIFGKDHWIPNLEAKKAGLKVPRLLREYFLNLICKPAPACPAPLPEGVYVFDRK
jgi:hypothetical protein